MRTALDAPAEALDAHERSFVSNIREHGWFSTNVFADDMGPGFTYTTGFWVTLRFPEIIIFSLRSEIAHEVLWNVFRDVQAGNNPPVGKQTRVFANTDGIFLSVLPRHYPRYLGWSRWFYGGDDFPCLQLMWPDTQGRFPWQQGTQMQFNEAQPNLSRDNS